MIFLRDLQGPFKAPEQCVQSLSVLLTIKVTIKHNYVKQSVV